MLALISLLNLQRSGAVLRRLQRDRYRLDLGRDGPAEGSNFPCNRSDYHSVERPLRGQSSTTGAHPALRLPSNLAHSLRQQLLPSLVCGSHTGRMSMGPRRFDQCLPCAAVARLGDPALPPCVARAAFGWYQAEECHQLTRMLETAEVPGFGDDCCRSQKTDATHGLECRNHRCHHPG